MMVAALATPWWYRRGEMAFVPSKPWTVRLDEGRGTTPREFSERERTLLRYNDAFGRRWDDSAGRRWTMNFIRWDTGNAVADNAKYHRPTICLVDIGHVLDSTAPVRVVTVTGVASPIRRYRFIQGSRSLDSFYCLWDELGRRGARTSRTTGTRRTGRPGPDCWMCSPRAAAAGSSCRMPPSWARQRRRPRPRSSGASSPVWSSRVEAAPPQKVMPRVDWTWRSFLSTPSGGLASYCSMTLRLSVTRLNNG